MNTLENNKLIAEFMGLVEPYELPQHGTIRPNGDFKTGFTSAQLKYHKSWDWLMPVVEKVNLLTRDNEKVTEYFTSELGSYDYMKYMLGDVVVTSGITDVFPEVVEFIKWYNENK
jgi:hypothetical protein